MMFDRQLVDVEDMLISLNLSNVKRNGNEVQFSCPFPQHPFGDVHPSASMNVNTTLFHCFSCHESGDAVQFLAKLEGVSPVLAVRWLRERYEVPEDGGSAHALLERRLGQKKREEKPPEVQELPDRVPGVIEIDWQKVRKDADMSCDSPWSYIFHRGFTVDTLEDFGWAYDSVTDRLVFRIRDEHGRVIGMKGRAWKPYVPNKYIAIGDTPRTMGRRGFMPFQSGRVLFNLDLASKSSSREFVLVEGELNAMMLRQNALPFRGDEPPVVGLSGSRLSDHQALLLRKHAESVVLFFDSDDAGLDGMQKADMLLEPYMPVRIVPLHEGDVCSMVPSESLKLVIDARSRISSFARRHI